MSDHVAKRVGSPNSWTARLWQISVTPLSSVAGFLFPKSPAADLLYPETILAEKRNTVLGTVFLIEREHPELPYGVRFIQPNNLEEWDLTCAFWPNFEDAQNFFNSIGTGTCPIT